MRNLIKKSLIFYTAIKTFFAVIFAFFGWLFKQKPVKYFMAVMMVIMAVYIAGFFIYLSDIKESWKDIVNSNHEIVENTDAIVVLTGGSERIRHGLFLLEQGKSDKLFISGVNKDVKLKELLHVHDYKSKQDIKDIAYKITLGFEAEDTVENAKEIKDWLATNNVKTIRLVTSNYHIKRALLEIRNKIDDENITIIPHAVIPLYIRIDKWWRYSPTRKLLFREYTKLFLAEIRQILRNIGLAV